MNLATACRAHLNKVVMSKYHVSVAAEAFAAAVLARFGFEVSVQYGANQPGYDLVAVKGRRMLKINVKGSENGDWPLLAGYRKDRTWTQAVDAWRSAQASDLVLFFVSFHDADWQDMPAMYLARPREVARHLKEGRRGNVATCLHVERHFKKGVAKGCTDRIPASWAFSKSRLRQITAV